jgi:hypothetical protein
MEVSSPNRFWRKIGCHLFKRKLTTSKDLISFCMKFVLTWMGQFFQTTGLSNAYLCFYYQCINSYHLHRTKTCATLWVQQGMKPQPWIIWGRHTNWSWLCNYPYCTRMFGGFLQCKTLNMHWTCNVGLEAMMLGDWFLMSLPKSQFVCLCIPTNIY